MLYNYVLAALTKKISKNIEIFLKIANYRINF